MTEVPITPEMRAQANLLVNAHIQEINALTPDTWKQYFTDKGYKWLLNEAPKLRVIYDNNPDIDPQTWGLDAGLVAWLLDIFCCMDKFPQEDN